jgi:CDP-diglyceride synthetase
MDVHFMAIVQATLLLAVANGTPVIATWILRQHLSFPLDGGTLFVDGRPLFGKSKTVRGIVLAILLTALAAPALGLGWQIGAAIGSTAMAGDLFSSYLKRRMGLPPSSRATGLDQVPESLLPVLICRSALGLSALDLGICVVVFFVGELVLSRLLYMAHVREQPY